ncbi:MAG: ABC transporter ATP-binding protein [Peptococcaceae bacterium]|nr:ABC transporter ATP-binding protein [Peptococcaceae bacterium]
MWSSEKAVILSTDRLSKSYVSGEFEQLVLKDIELSIYERDFTVIMGSSGAGKSTLLYILSGMDRPTSGTVRFFNKNIARFSNNRLAVFRRKNCGFIFQQMFLLENMSIMDNILATGLLINRNREEIVADAKKLLKRVGLTATIWRKFPSQLSGGENQRAAIVRALINKPRVVFADEPTGSLNSAAGQAVLDVLTDISRKGQGIIMVTHDLKSALRGNRVLYLHDGIVCGECSLGDYEGEDPRRLNKLQDFLSSMGW